MKSLPISELSLRGKAAAHASWAATADRSARTAPARRAMQQKFLEAAGGDPERAEHLRKAHYYSMSLKAAQARRKAAEARATLDAAEAELDALAGGADA